MAGRRDWIYVVQDKELGSQLCSDCKKGPARSFSLHAIKAYTYMVKCKYTSIRS